jgi:hypothetical protein
LLEKKSNKILWGGLINYYFENLILFMVSIFINLRFFDVKSSLVDILNAIYTIVALLIIIVIPSVTFYNLKKKLLSAKRTIKEAKVVKAISGKQSVLDKLAKE